MKYFLVFLVFCSFLYGKKDFYYNFVNPDLSQITQSEKRKIVGASDKLKEIRRYIKEGQLDTALKHVITFENSNDVALLDSAAVLLHSEILYKMNTTPRAIDANKLLEKAINTSVIDQEDLLEAYRLLVLIKIKINKMDEASYYANEIGESFDDPLSKVYGKVALSQIYVKTRDYNKAIKILRQELINTTSLEVATIIADELYDAYILNKEDQKAYELVEKVLNRNIDYYANDSYKALNKVDKLVDAGMPEFAIDILNKLIENSRESKSIDNFRFKLANTYMEIAGFDKKYLAKAKAIYEELIQLKYSNPFKKKAKMYLDEIIMREGKFDPAMMASKYNDSETMQFKAMMQELINSMEDEKYEQILRMKKIYYGIPELIVKRYGYESMDQIYNMVNSRMVQYYLNTNQCKQLNMVIKDISDDALLLLLKDQKSIDELFDCMLELPDERTYRTIKNVYAQVKDAKVNFYLERVAIALKKYDEAFTYSQKLDMFSEPKILSKEFLYRYLIYRNQKNSQALQRFFAYARSNPEFIIDNENNPKIIDFYHSFYLYLLKEQEEQEATDILKKLYTIQNRMKARVYSPFVEIELARYAKLDDDYDQALEYLQHGLHIKRQKDGRSVDRYISDDEKARIYYEIAKIYEYQKRENRYKDAVRRCNRLKNTDSYYKKMCEKM
jgi:predicted negative regulator of RcsB-dependent stress response